MLYMRKAKKQYYVDKLSECSGRNQSWSIIKSLMPNKNDTKSSSNIPRNDSLSKATEFNHCQRQLLQIWCKNNLKLITLHRALPCQTNLTFTAVSEGEVMNEINKLKNKKSVGIDGISVQILKSCADILIQTITYISNKSIKEGKYRVLGKYIAKVIPLHKKGDKSNPDHYRPMSLLLCMSKLMERIIQLQLLNYLKWSQ